MNTEQIAELYIGAASDFRELLGEVVRTDSNYEIMAVVSPGIYITYSYGLWHQEDMVSHSDTRLLQSIAVAAMIECWRERLGEKHGVWWVVPKMGEFVPMRGIGTAQVLQNGVFATAGVYKTAKGQTGRDGGTVFKSLAEAIVAAVKALAAEKRAKTEKEEEDKAAKIAADLIKNCHRPMMIIPGPDPEEITEARVREIAREEVARTKVYWMGVDPAVGKDRTVTYKWPPTLGAYDSRVVE